MMKMVLYVVDLLPWTFSSHEKKDIRHIPIKGYPTKYQYASKLSRS